MRSNERWYGHICFPHLIRRLIWLVDFPRGSPRRAPSCIVRRIEDETGLRDRALLLVGFAAALRPSEIAGLALAHVTRHADGIELFLPWRKNDQDARSTRLWLPQGRTELCPVTALDAWLAAAAITEGPLIRRIWRLPPPRIPRGIRRNTPAMTTPTRAAPSSNTSPVLSPEGSASQ